MPFGLYLASSSVHLLCSTLDQKDLEVAQKLVFNQWLLSTREVHMSDTRTRDDIGDPTSSHYDVSGLRVLSFFSSSALQFLPILL